MYISNIRLAPDAEPTSAGGHDPSSTDVVSHAAVSEWVSQYRATLQNWSKVSDAEIAAAKNALKEVLGITAEFSVKLMVDSAGSAIIRRQGTDVVLGTLLVNNDQGSNELWKKIMNIEFDPNRPLSEQEDVAKEISELSTKYEEAILSGREQSVPLQLHLDSGDVSLDGRRVTSKADTSRQIYQIVDESRIELSSFGYLLNRNADVYVDWKTTRKGERWEIQDFDCSYLFSTKAKEFESASVDLSEIERRAAVRNWKLTIDRTLEQGGRLLSYTGGTFFQANPGEPFRVCPCFIENTGIRGDPDYLYCLTPVGDVYLLTRGLYVEEFVEKKTPAPAEFFGKIEKCPNLPGAPAWKWAQSV